MKKVANGVYSVSIYNPNMRSFDVELHTEYGTSYNSYVVYGSLKTAVIEANHETFAEEWLAQVEAAMDGREPDYLVVNHTEPDHSGAVAACCKLYPNITVLCSSSAAIMLKNITNDPDFKPQVVKDGDSVDLGGMTLEFYGAPFLHWPDTMFTWLLERKVAFTCDFLGSHFCEPLMFDYSIVYRREFSAAFKEYYDAIMYPFPSWVQNGLKILDALKPEIVATSHGPILTKDCVLDRCIEFYRKWSTENEAAPKKIPIFYCSAYKNTEKLALSIAKGVRKTLPFAKVSTFDLVNADIEQMADVMNESDAFLLGSPTINKTALPTVWNLVAEIDAINIAKRPVALFGSYGWSGEALPHLAARLQSLKAKVFEPQFKVQLVPTNDDLAAAEEFGKAFAESL